MKISNKSISTAARQTLRKVRRINRILSGMAASRGYADLLDHSSAIDMKVVRLCKRQRRAFLPFVNGTAGA